MSTTPPVPPAPLTDDGRYDQAPRGRQPSGWRGISWGWWAALAIFVVGIIIVGVLLLFDDDAPARETASVNDIVEGGDEMTGEDVILTGRIDELLTDRAVVIGSDVAPEDVLVLIEPEAFVRGYGLGTGAVPYPVGETYEVGDVVQVSGTVREFDRDELSDELGIVLNDELFDGYTGDMALVIDRLDVATVGGPLVITSPAPAE